MTEIERLYNEIMEQFYAVKAQLDLLSVKIKELKERYKRENLNNEKNAV